MTANYDSNEVQEGAIFTNAAGTKTVEILKRTYWASGNYNVFGFECRVTTPEMTYVENLTRRMIEHRYPVKSEKLRFAIENLTAEQMQAVVDLLGKKNVTVTRTN